MRVRVTKLTDLIPRGVRNYRTKLCPGSLKASSNAWNRVALGTLLFLIIDPTVAAHWPVVMTDLPVALLLATATVLATRAFREWLWKDLAACSLFLGLALAMKHSAPVVLLSVVLIGIWVVFSRPIPQGGDARSH